MNWRGEIFGGTIDGIDTSRNRGGLEARSSVHNFLRISIFASSYGFRPSEIVEIWALPGLLFGVAIFVVSLLNNLLRLIENRQRAAEIRRNNEREARASFLLLRKRQSEDEFFCELHPGIIANRRKILRGRW